MSVIRNILNSRSSKGGNFFNTLHKLLGFRPKDLSVYERAFTHRSLNVKDPSGNPINYERLEFLGDAMLGSVIASHLYQEVPEGDEGYLTKMRSKIVSREHLNELGKDLNLIKFVKKCEFLSFRIFIMIVRFSKCDFWIPEQICDFHIFFSRKK